MDGTVAEITVVPNLWADQQNDVCQLWVNGAVVGVPFGCKGSFTTVTWQDITGDGSPEITVLALSGKQPRDQDFNQLSDVDCVHQRFLAFQWEGGGATPIADVAGCVVDLDLFGIRLEDYTGDKTLEIITPYSLYVGDECLENPDLIYGNCWYELASDPGLRVYGFNGQEYVLWEEIPAR